MKKLILLTLLIVGCEEVLEPQDCAGLTYSTVMDIDGEHETGLPPPIVPSVKLVVVRTERHRAYDT